jgi:hypothetical protein
MISAEGAELFGHEPDYALAALGLIELPDPRALPWAITFRAFGAAIQNGFNVSYLEKCFLCKVAKYKAQRPKSKVQCVAL